MSIRYDDPNNQPLTPVPKNEGVMGFIKKNKWLVILAIIVLALLIWYFGFRKSGDDVTKTVTNISTMPGNGPSVTISRPNKLH